MGERISDLRLIFLIGFVQFLDILDFMVVMPLGPDYARPLNIDITELGLTAAAYTISAAFSGFVSSIYIDKFERKRALLLAIAGVVLADIYAGFSLSYEHLLVARFFAGIFGGPCTALSFAIIIDLVPEERRGYVIGKVMSAFSFAASIGVPICLQISYVFGWRFAFFTVSFIGIFVILANLKYLPIVNAHLKLENNKKIVTYKNLFFNKLHLTGFSFSALGLFAAFMIIPYISAYLQYNSSVDRSLIGPLYFAGGVFSFFTVQFIGSFIDKYSSSKIILISNILLGVTLFFGFIYPVTSLVLIFIIYVFFMMGMSIRMVANSTLISKIPEKHERAGFMSLVSMFQHIFSALGSYATSIILIQDSPTSPLSRMNIVALISFVIFMIIPSIMRSAENKLKIRRYE